MKSQNLQILKNQELNKNKSKKPKGADAFLNDSLESSFKESTLKSMEEDQEKKKNQQLFTEEDEDEDHVK